MSDSIPQPYRCYSAWLIVFNDPDGLRLRLYTLATHGPDLKPDEDSPWLKYPIDEATQAQPEVRLTPGAVPG